MQALENMALRSWVNTYPLWPNARMGEAEGIELTR
jgi:hypothetical protein